MPEVIFVIGLSILLWILALLVSTRDKKKK